MNLQMKNLLKMGRSVFYTKIRYVFMTVGVKQILSLNEKRIRCKNSQA